MAELVEPAVAVLVGIMIAAASSMITVKLSLKRYRTEQWWERKAQAYGDLIEALHKTKRFFDAHLEAASRDTSLDEDFGDSLSKGSEEGRQQIQRLVDIGTFYLCPQALERLRAFEKEYNGNRDCPNWIEYLDLQIGAVVMCLDDIKVIAKRDLGIA